MLNTTFTYRDQDGREHQPLGRDRSDVTRARSVKEIQEAGRQFNKWKNK